MLNVCNEYGKLKKVLMASVATFRLHEPINSTQRYYYQNDPPVLEKLIKQQRVYIDTLKKHGVIVIMADKREDSTNQLNTRDVAFVIGNSFIVSPMKEKIRQNEHYALESLIAHFSPDDRVLRPTSGVIEGGDIVLSNNTIYVGLSQRTNLMGIEWLKDNFGHVYEIVPIYLSEGFLHLDVVFNILSDELCLVCEKGIQRRSLDLISSRFTPIYVESEEQINLPTNVLSISPNLLIADSRNVKTNKLIAEYGIEIEEIDFSEISKIGGSFRCSTCPLERE